MLTSTGVGIGEDDDEDGLMQTRRIISPSRRNIPGRNSRDRDRGRQPRADTDDEDGG